MKKFVILFGVIASVFLGHDTVYAQDNSVNRNVPTCEFDLMVKAIRKDKAKQLIKFLNARPGYDVDCRNDVKNSTMLVNASAFGLKNIVPVLISHGADVNFRTPTGGTPILLASGNRGSKKIVMALEAAGADIHAVNNAGYNLVLLSVASNDVDLFTYTKNKGVDLHKKDVKGSTGSDIIKFMWQQGFTTNRELKSSSIYQTLLSNGVPLSVPFTGVEVIKNDGTKENLGNGRKPSKGLPGILGSIITTSDGTGRKCNHLIIVGNLAGENVKVKLFAKLTDGRRSPYPHGEFMVNVGKKKGHQIFLTQGGNQIMEISSVYGGARRDQLKFKVPETCVLASDYKTTRIFMVENTNNNGRLKIFEDNDQDFKRNVSSQPMPSGTQIDMCLKLLPLATEINNDSSGLAYSDVQLSGLLSAAGCQIPDKVSTQRTRLKNLLSK